MKKFVIIILSIVCLVVGACSASKPETSNLEEDKSNMQLPLHSDSPDVKEPIVKESKIPYTSPSPDACNKGTPSPLQTSTPTKTPISNSTVIPKPTEAREPKPGLSTPAKTSVPRPGLAPTPTKSLAPKPSITSTPAKTSVPKPTVVPTPAKTPVPTKMPKSAYDYEFDIDKIKMDCINIGIGMGLRLDKSLTPDNSISWNPVIASISNQGLVLKQELESYVRFHTIANLKKYGITAINGFNIYYEKGGNGSYIISFLFS